MRFVVFGVYWSLFLVKSLIFKYNVYNMYVYLILFIFLSLVMIYDYFFE